MNAFVTSTSVAFSARVGTAAVCRVGAGSLRLAAATVRGFRTTVSSPLRATPSMEMDMGSGSDEPAPVLEETKLFVGNLSWNTTDASLGEAFSVHGEVIDSRVVVDRFTGKSRGFGFVEFSDPASTEAALEGMNGVEVDGRSIRVDRANRRTERPRRNFY